MSEAVISQSSTQMSPLPLLLLLLQTFRAMVEDMFNVLTTAHVLVFVFSLLGGLLTWLLVLRPYLRRTGK
jgi:positive regulator of sigma E activity